MFKKLLPFFIIISFIIIYFGKKIIPHAGTFIGGADIGCALWWNALFIKNQFLSGHLPLWNPYDYCGHPFVANPTTCVFYPATLLFVFLPLPYAFNFDIILHLIIAAIGTYYVTFLLTKSSFAGITAALIFSLSGYFINRIALGHVTVIHAAALVPWLFYFVEKGIQNTQKRFFIFVGSTLGLQILSGDPQINFYSAFFITIYFFIRYLQKFRIKNTSDYFKPFFFYSLIPLFAFGIGAAQLLPSFEFKLLSDRASNSYEFASYMSFPFDNFFSFLIPFNDSVFISKDWEYGCYVGILTIILSLIGWLSSNSNQKWNFGVIIILALTMMLGEYTPIYKFYYRYVPLISTFRIPARCVVILILILSILSGIGAQFVFEKNFNRKNFIAIVGLLFVCAIVIFLSAWKYDISFLSKGLIRSICIILTASLFFSLLFFVKDRKKLKFLCLIIFFIDLYSAQHSLIPQMDSKEFTTENEIEKFLKKDKSLSRVYLPWHLTSRSQMSHHSNINGFSPIVLDRYYQFVHNMADLKIPQNLRHTLNPVFSNDEEYSFASKILNLKYALIGNQLITRKDVIPRATIIDRAIFFDEWESHIKFMQKKEFNPQEVVLLHKDDSQLIADILNKKKTQTQNNHFKKNINISSYETNKIKIEAISYDSMTKYELQRTGYDAKKIREFNWNYLKSIGTRMIKADIRNQQRLLDEVSGSDFIVHTAAQPAMTISWEDPNLDFTSNVSGTYNVLEAARKHNIPVVSCSSIHVYGNDINQSLEESETRYLRNPAAISEKHDIMKGFLTPLHASKRCAEVYLDTWVNMYQLKAATFRYTGIYGPRQFGGEDHGWVANFLIRALLDWPP